MKGSLFHLCNLLKIGKTSKTIGIGFANALGWTVMNEPTAMGYKKYVEKDIDDAWDAVGPFFEFQVNDEDTVPEPAKNIVLSSLLGEA